MNEICPNCYWNYAEQCCSESLKEIVKDKTFQTNNCVGFLRKDFGEHMLDMKAEILVFCNDEDIARKIKNLSYKDTLEFYRIVKGWINE